VDAVNRSGRKLCLVPFYKNISHVHVSVYLYCTEPRSSSSIPRVFHLLFYCVWVLQGNDRKISI
jgi:hypothetical protein